MKVNILIMGQMAIRKDIYLVLEEILIRLANEKGID